MMLPEEWDDRTVYTFMGPDEYGLQHMLTLTIEEGIADTELEEYAQERIDAVLEPLQSVDVLKDEAITLANGKNAYECVYKWVPVEGKIMYRRLVYLLENGTGYSFAAIFTWNTMKTLGVDVDNMINSFTPDMVGKA
jgi:hypothetical protein